MIKVMIDKNILISSALFTKGKVAKAYLKVVQPPFQPYVCDYIIEELRRKFCQKFPDKMVYLYAFLFHALQTIKEVKTPIDKLSEEEKIRDPKDRPILRAALKENIEILLTGDKDFLEANVTNPKIMSVTDFLEL